MLQEPNHEKSDWCARREDPTDQAVANTPGHHEITDRQRLLSRMARGLSLKTAPIVSGRNRFSAASWARDRIADDASVAVTARII